MKCGLALLVIAFAAWAAHAQRPAAPKKEKRHEELVADLKSSSTPRRVDAVDGLARLATPEAWQLVLGCLGDAEADVADEAQLALARLEEPVAIAALFGDGGLGSKVAERSVRAAEAIGRVKGVVAADALGRGLGAEDAEARRLLCWSIERRARAGKIEAADLPLFSRKLLSVLTKDDDAAVRAASLCALAVVEPDKARPWITSMLGKKDPVGRIAALANANLLPAPQPFELARRHAREGAFAVRSQALANLSAFGSKPAALVIVERLEKEESLGVRWAALRELQRLSGSDVELVPAFWRSWVEKLPDDWRAAGALPLERDGPKPTPEGPGTSQFLGLPVASQSVAILIDLSGSIRLPNREGLVRKDVVDRELARTLRAFEPRTRFNLVPYGTKPDPWSERVRPATKESVEEALAFFSATKATGFGNLWDSIELALADPEVENLLVLTDGQLTAGRHTSVVLVRELLIERLRFRRITVDVLLVDARPQTQAEWRELCERSGGRMLPVALR